MLTSELIDQNIPRLQLHDTIGKAKQLINDFKLTHLPVISEKKYLGLISEDDLLDFDDDKAIIENINEHIQLIYVPDDVHFLNAIGFCNQYESNIVPVLDKEAVFIGVITATELLKMLGEFSGANEIGGIIVLETERIHFSLSEISRIVESNDCTILHLNTMTNVSNGALQITLHLNKREIAAVAATFQRFEYHIVHQFGFDKFEDRSDTNFRNLMNYLEI